MNLVQFGLGGLLTLGQWLCHINVNITAFSNKNVRKFYKNQSKTFILISRILPTNERGGLGQHYKSD